MEEFFYRRGDHYAAMHAHMTADVEFYRDLAARLGGPILELACGTGRIALPLADDGHRVTGIDIAESMLDYARRAGEDRARFLHADMRAFELDERFPLILLAFNAIGHLHTRADVYAMLDRVRAHLAPDGRFVIALFNPDLGLLNRRPEAEREVARYPDPDSDADIMVTETARYDRASQILTAYWRYAIGEREEQATLQLRMFFPQELEALLEHRGFEVAEKYGDFDFAPFRSEAPHQLLVAAARG